MIEVLSHFEHGESSSIGRRMRQAQRSKSPNISQEQGKLGLHSLSYDVRRVLTGASQLKSRSESGRVVVVGKQVENVLGIIGAVLQRFAALVARYM